MKRQVAYSHESYNDIIMAPTPRVESILYVHVPIPTKMLCYTCSFYTVFPSSIPDRNGAPWAFASGYIHHESRRKA